ncbi:MAG: hypothetical protein EXX96DRAFT_620866 [Benjaminiella poitrasii]|nr:MAG: hypothetical protein EXX96DRAFT_620866 [Benjaminiella poitrasii]
MIDSPSSSSSSQVADSAQFQLNQPLVVEDQQRRYFYILNDDDVANDTIEQMYGPFEDRVENYNYPKRHQASVRKDLMSKRLKEIEKLKREIYEKELQMKKSPADKQKSPTVSVPVNQMTERNPLELQKEIDQKNEQIKELKALDNVTQSSPTVSSLQTNVIDVVESKEKNLSDAADTNKQMSDNELNDVIAASGEAVLINDEIDLINENDDMDLASEDMDISSDDMSLIDDSTALPNNIAKEPSTFLVDAAAIDDDISSQSSFKTADEDFSTMETEPTKDKLSIDEAEIACMALENEIKELNEKLEKITQEKNKIHVNLLAMRVRMSVGRNTRELAGRSSTTKNSPSPIPRLGAKRHIPESNPRRSYKRPYVPKQQHNASFPNFGYQVPAFPNTSSQFNPSFAPTPNHFMNSHMSFSNMQMPVQLSTPPPPPPSYLPPPSSPPPPPPPLPSRALMPSSSALSNRSSGHSFKFGKHEMYRKNRKKPTEPEQSSKSKDLLRNILDEIVQLISIRIFSYDKEYPYVANRPLPRPRRMITENEQDNQYQKNDHSFILPLGQPVEYQLTNESYESPLFRMLQRKALAGSFSPEWDSVYNAILYNIPQDMDLSTFYIRHAYGMSLYPEKLMSTYDLVRAFSSDYPTNVFLASLTLELCLYAYGPLSDRFQEDFKEIIKIHPCSIDIYWQYILQASEFPDRLARIIDLLELINRTYQEPETASCLTAEVLTRLIRLNGLSEVLKLLTNNQLSEINCQTAELYSLDSSTGLALTPSDKYYVWMLILHYYVTRSLPPGVCDKWMIALVKNGEPQTSKLLFMIDWRNALETIPLDRPTLFGATNILLSMLSHYSKMTSNNRSRKPLLIGVLRTLMSFLNYTPCYKTVGTYVLANKMIPISELSPEIDEILFSLECKKGDSVDQLMKTIISRSAKVPIPQLFILAYRVCCMFSEENKYTEANMYLMATLLMIPICRTKFNDEELLEFVNRSRQTDQVQPELKTILVQAFRKQYKEFLGFEKWLSEAEQKNKQITFAWINLLLLGKISQVVQPDQSKELMQDTNIIYKEGRQSITSNNDVYDDGFMILSKYGEELLEEDKS